MTISETGEKPAEPPAQAGAEPEVGRAELRRAAFLQAAREVFFEHGYEAANMAEIVRRAGGSLSTLYAQFGGKQGLYEAMIDARVAVLTRQTKVELAAHAPLREGLQRIGEEFMLQMCEPESLDVFRLMVAQAKKFPDMAHSYAKRGPDLVRKALADYLRDRAEAGELKIRDYDMAAATFYDLVRARLHFRALLDPTYKPAPDEVREAVARGVRVFLGGVEAM